MGTIGDRYMGTGNIAKQERKGNEIMVRLNYQPVRTGYLMTFENGKVAGVIIYSQDCLQWQWRPKGCPKDYGPKRCTREAADYDALAWAEEYVAKKGGAL